MRGPGSKMGRGAAATAALVLAVPAFALAGGRAADALAKLEQGRWIVRSAGAPSAGRSICLGDPALLFQLEHGPTGCSQKMVSADERGATAEYVCPGRGFGHTNVRVETSKAATIETQGFVDGRPFAYRATARKLSPC